jgi:hypothetical protein
LIVPFIAAIVISSKQSFRAGSPVEGTRAAYERDAV